MNRNAPCPCGSGKRYKHCCGREGQAPAPATRDQALAAQRAGRLGRAETLYRRALAENPDDVDCAHMLGVVQMERLRYREALELLWEAAERTAWASAPIRHNLGLALGKLMTTEANARQAELLAEFVEWERSRPRRDADFSPLVSVVLRAHDAGDVAAAIASVVAQTYSHLEIVVVDDAADEATAASVEAMLAQVPMASRVVRRDRAGVAAAWNAGAASARGDYLAFLDAADAYAPDRIECLVDAIARAGVAWGFSLVSSVSTRLLDEGNAQDESAGIAWQRQRGFLGKYSNSFALVDYDLAASPGNLFVARDFFDRLGGFHDLTHHAQWEFCLRAIAFDEPIVVPRPLYLVGRGPQKTASSLAAAAQDAQRLLAAFFETALAHAPECTNRFAPQWPANRLLFLRTVLCAPRGALVPVAVLKATAGEWRARQARMKQVPVRAQEGRKTAIVVLGMHRSGTSALSRLLNLCGAFLPAKIKPAKLGVNSKGFWEPEEVLEFNGRVLRQLGGEWNRVDFALPEAGEFVQEFEADARVLLASEYGDERTILIKDPRMAVLAPLWHRALEAAGYRAVYVVPVRHPLEVARSLHARGDMSVDDGLALWRVYMERIAAFADAHPDAVVHVEYPEVLEDWRRVVERIARRIDVPLAAGDRSDEVDRFLEEDLRHHAASDDELASGLPADSKDAILTLHRRFQDRCRRDRAADFDALHTRVGGGRPAVADAPAATASFVLCIENNGIREQALLLCRSIRRYAGRLRDAPILAYAPRPGLGVDAATRRQLEELRVEYVDAPLNTTCPEYPPANRVFAGAHAERCSDAEFLIVTDSDTVWLDEPELPLDADAAVRPVDAKGSATRGPGDRFEAYWERLAEVAGITLDRLPMLRSTIGDERIRASYNAGFTIVRRRLGILTRCAELFAASLGEGLRPYRDSGVEIVASTGRVGREGSEYWGSSQTALTLAIWASTDRVLHYPDWYNLPLHLVAFDRDVDARWLQRSPVHVHYHWMFDARHHENGMELLARLRVPADRRAWLLERTPFRDAPADAGTAAPPPAASVEPRTARA
jgi:hypothetical protein